MNALNAVRLALQAIRRNLLRSFLTVLGVIIGVSAVITMVTLGQGATRAVQNQIASLGSNLLQIRPGQRLGPMMDAGGAPPFALADAPAIQSQVSGLVAVAPEVRSAGAVVSGARNWTTSIVGSSAAYLTANSWTLAAGRNFETQEERIGAAVCIIGATVRRELYGTRMPLGQQLRVKQFSCEIIGLLASKGQAAMGIDQDDVVILPLATVQRRVTGSTRVQTLLVRTRDDVDADRVKAAVTALLRERRHLSDTDEDNFNVLDTRQIADALSGTTRIMTTLLGAVAAVSLLVGGIGIMNIMLVSVTERTREIGIRLAIGALEREVLLQFLVEAVTLSVLGGLVGVVLAALGSAALATAMQVPFQFNVTINLVALGFAALVGVIFGYVPARRAARMDPIQALRHE